MSKRIEIEYLGSLIEVYNSASKVSLVINGQIVDEHRGLKWFTIDLYGSIAGGKRIHLKWRLWSPTLNLYCGDFLIARKWILF